MSPKARKVFLERPPLPERNFVAEALRQETVGGAVLLVAAAVAVGWANSPLGDAYEALRDARLGPAGWHLDLTVEAWAADGVLALFFFVAGLELKRELVVGQLRKPSAAVLPVVAAACGMAVPALVYLVTTLGEPGTARGWAVPTATDIAFALAVLAVIGSHLPGALRAFLLTLAVVDDLGAILIIAVVYTSGLQAWALAAAMVLCGLYALAQRLRVTAWWVYVPLAVLTWAAVHGSGVHATVAGVALGMLTRTRPDRHEDRSPAERLEHRLRPLSAGVAVPLFALTAAGVAVSGDDLGRTFGDPAALGVACGLVLGKLIGVYGGTRLVVRFSRAELNPDLRWADIGAVSVLAGVGFTVALLIGDLAFADQPARAEHVKAGVLAGSLVAAVIAAGWLRLRDRHHRELSEREERDEDGDGIPDVYQSPPAGQTGAD